MIRTEVGLEERYITNDEFHRDYDGLLFTVDADLFIPAGGRPETVDDENWRRFLDAEGKPSCRAVVEGANSFLTPGARDALQEKGVVVIRDASANKCGVISSSYEIIANLLLTEREFIAHKDSYVADVLALLVRRAGDEARLIFERHREARGELSFTKISEGLSREINGHYQEFFTFFQARPELWKKRLFRAALLHHLPTWLLENRRYASRVRRLPEKIRAAILSVEIATLIVYGGGWAPDLESALTKLLGERLGD